MVIADENSNSVTYYTMTCIVSFAINVDDVMKGLLERRQNKDHPSPQRIAISIRAHPSQNDPRTFNLAPEIPASVSPDYRLPNRFAITVARSQTGLPLPARRICHSGSRQFSYSRLSARVCTLPLLNCRVLPVHCKQRGG